MKKLHFYTVFHLNLMYSSIEEEDRIAVIQRCYWQLLKLAGQGFHIGIEAPAITLEIIKSIDTEWINTLKDYMQRGVVEFIGSGYTQLIGPLVPAKVNDWNQKIGLEVYTNILGKRSDIALVNEMAYSAGIVEHYVNHGYKALIMEWNNPKKYYPEWNDEWRYFPQIATGCGENRIPVIWAKSIAFQKFQRFIHGDIGLDEYIRYLKSHVTTHHRYFPLYTNDVEIFDFRPGRFKTEATLSESAEWKKILKLFKILKRERDFLFVLPTQVLKGLNSRNGGNRIRLESSEQPIPVKKQEKYNINRWALTGRDDFGINTKCYAIYNYLKNLSITSVESWKELCYLWSSDFRTHITKKRWLQYRKRLNRFTKKHSLVDNTQEDISSTVRVLKKIPYKTRRLRIFKKGRFINVENGRYLVEFNIRKGLSINSLVFKNISGCQLFGTLEHGFFDDISLGADFYSGHAVIEQPGRHKVSDLNLSQYSIVKTGDKYLLRSHGILDKMEFELVISFNENTITLLKKIKHINTTFKIIRPFHFTFIPESWNKRKLFYRTHNGGEKLEKFFLKDTNCNQSSLYSPLISSIYGMGATEGIVDIGDDKKVVRFLHKNSKCALIPKITFRDKKNKRYFLRLEYSAQEIDETFRISNEQRSICSSVEIFPFVNE